MVDYPIPYPLSIGRIRAGDWPSSVPDLLIAEGRYGLRIEEDPAEARIELEEVVEQVAARDPYLRDHPPRVAWSGGQFRGGALPPGHELGGLIGSAHADVTATSAAGGDRCTVRQRPPTLRRRWRADPAVRSGRCETRARAATNRYRSRR